MMKKRILYIHHGHAKGGAFLSLLYLLKALEHSEYEPIICSGEGDEEVTELFAKNGYKTCRCRLPRFPHTTLGSYNLLKYSGWRRLIVWFSGYKRAQKRFKAVLDELKPDMVHLNSLTLAPYTKTPHLMGIPTVVHVREPIVNGFFGIRRKWLISRLNRYADRVIAICHDNLDRLRLVPGLGRVIYNPVDFTKFDDKLDKRKARLALEIPQDAQAVLFAGGSDPVVKGLFEYLKAMRIVKAGNDKLICLMPSFRFPFSPRERHWTLKRRLGWLAGIYRRNDRLFQVIEKSGLHERIIACDFTYEIEQWIAACDIVCVPHIKPHFSRTVIEAGAMRKPVVTFRIGGIEEIVSHGENGLLVDTGDVPGLAREVQYLLSTPAACRSLGDNNRAQSEKLFAAEISATQIMEVYNELALGNNS